MPLIIFRIAMYLLVFSFFSIAFPTNGFSENVGEASLGLNKNDCTWRSNSLTLSPETHNPPEYSKPYEAKTKCLDNETLLHGICKYSTNMGTGAIFGHPFYGENAVITTIDSSNDLYAICQMNIGNDKITWAQIASYAYCCYIK